MDFFLPFTIPKFPFNISYHSKIFFIGSCFSREIGDRMATLKFNVVQNPNGILYNPQSIEKAISSYLLNRQFTDDDLINHNGIYHSPQHHSSFSGLDKEEVLAKINQSQSGAYHFLQGADILIITFGTAFCYQSERSGEIVANCHKMPADNFQKKLLEIEEIETSYLNLLGQLKKFNPRLKIVFTISPVKHVRDGLIENVRSKARLIEVVHSIISKSHDTFYFPSYELVTDVLRDYRFYKTDLVHPSSVATDFVFQKFCESFLDASTNILQNNIENILQMLNHRPRFRGSDDYNIFKKTLANKIERLKHDFPFIDFSEEKKRIFS